VHRLSAQHPSVNLHRQTDVDTVIPADLIRGKKCNPAGGRFCQIVEIWLDLDTGSDIRASLASVRSLMALQAWYCDVVFDVNNDVGDMVACTGTIIYLKHLSCLVFVLSCLVLSCWQCELSSRQSQKDLNILETEQFCLVCGVNAFEN